jgi:hypothetical protein
MKFSGHVLACHPLRSSTRGEPLIKLSQSWMRDTRLEMTKPEQARCLAVLFAQTHRPGASNELDQGG